MSQTFNVTTAASGTGTACPTSPNTTTCTGAYGVCGCTVNVMYGGAHSYSLCAVEQSMQHNHKFDVCVVVGQRQQYVRHVVHVRNGMDGHYLQYRLERLIMATMLQTCRNK
jgi:hypothetical protein